MKNINISVSLPSEILLALRESDKELALDMKRFTALKLYQDGRLSVGQCAELAEMNEEDFIKFLCKNQISIFQYSSQESLKEDFANA